MKFVPFFSTRRLIAVAAMLLLPMGAALADAGHGHKSASGVPGKAADVTRTITVVLRDVLFDKHEVRVRAGETVRFVLKNEGELLHEFNIGTPHSHAQHQKEMMEMMEMGMLTPTGVDPARMAMSHAGMGHTMKHDDPNSALVEPGKTKELIWKFTTEGTLEFACNLPGHYQAGMVGQVKVGG